MSGCLSGDLSFSAINGDLKLSLKGHSPKLISSVRVKRKEKQTVEQSGSLVALNA